MAIEQLMVLPVQAEVRVRTLDGRDADDNPTYEWVVLLPAAGDVRPGAGNAIPHLERAELDPNAAGTRYHKGTVLIWNADNVEIPETAQVRMLDASWRVTAAEPLPHQTLLTIERIGSGQG